MHPGTAKRKPGEEIFSGVSGASDTEAVGRAMMRRSANEHGTLRLDIGDVDIARVDPATVGNRGGALEVRPKGEPLITVESVEKVAQVAGTHPDVVVHVLALEP